MHAERDTTARAATAPESRIASIDVLRGFALLGILVMNVQSFSMPLAAYMNPRAYGDLTGLNHAIWLIGRLFFDMKFITIFSMLFGAGIAMAAMRETSKGRGVYARRYAFLLVLGLLHAYLLWYGDVLAYYAICAFALYPFRHKPVRTLLAAGAALYTIASLVLVLGAWNLGRYSDEELEAIRPDFAPYPEEVLPEIATMQSGFWEIFHHRLEFLMELHLFIFPVYLLPSLSALMLFGMALYKLGAVQAQWPGTRYAALIALALIVGVPLVHAGNLQMAAAEWSVQAVKFDGMIYNYWAAPLVALGWIGFVMLWCQSGRAPRLRHALSCVGRMALTNYILQTLIAVSVFYGYGLGWFGQVERTGQLAFVLVVWALQLAWSPLWLQHFRYGPLEWLWRSVTYGAMQPMRRRA